MWGPESDKSYLWIEKKRHGRVTTGDEHIMHACHPQRKMHMQCIWFDWLGESRSWHIHSARAAWLGMAVQLVFGWTKMERMEVTTTPWCLGRCRQRRGWGLDLMHAAGLKRS
jgi:hypothetical protein